MNATSATARPSIERCLPRCGWEPTGQHTAAWWPPEPSGHLTEWDHAYIYPTSLAADLWGIGLVAGARDVTVWAALPFRHPGEAMAAVEREWGNVEARARGERWAAGLWTIFDTELG